MWNDSKVLNRGYVWSNTCNAAQVMFMDPYLILWTSGTRNLPLTPVNGVGSSPTNYWDNLRDNLGQTAHYFYKFVNIPAAAQSSASTGNCLASTVSNSNQFLIYSISGGTFTVNLSTASGRVLVGEWLDPSALTTTTATPVSGGSSTQSFSTPGGFAADSVLFLQDSSLTNVSASSLSSSISVQGSVNFNGTISIRGP